jgi:hypothetical protein
VIISAELAKKLLRESQVRKLLVPLRWKSRVWTTARACARPGTASAAFRDTGRITTELRHDRPVQEAAQHNRVMGGIEVSELGPEGFRLQPSSGPLSTRGRSAGSAPRTAPPDRSVVRLGR